MNTARILSAVFFAPLAALLVWLGMFFESFRHDTSMLSIEGLIYFAFVGFAFLSISYAFTIMVGLPVHFIFSKLSIKSWWAYCVSGVLTPAIYQFAINQTNGMPAQLQAIGYIVYMACGFFVSLAFWFLAVKLDGSSIESRSSRAGI